MRLQVGWEGPSECNFCPTLGVLRLHGLSTHLRPSIPQIRSEPLLNTIHCRGKALCC